MSLTTVIISPGELLLIKRKNLKLKQNEVAIFFDCSWVTISRWENNHSIQRRYQGKVDEFVKLPNEEILKIIKEKADKNK